MSSEASRRGLMLIVSSPSGAGKTSLSRRLIAENGGLVLSVSATTREPRPGEQDGREYRFLTPKAFDAMVAAGDFIEWAEVHEHRYGTPRSPVLETIAAGRDVLFDIDWQGAAAIARAQPEEVVRVFVLPPSMGDLASRLHARAQDAEDVIHRRLERAYGEISHWGEYDYVIVNDDFDRAYAELNSILKAERLKRARNPWLNSFVGRLLDEKL
ncbi:MAG TPA: guanylate kinase [Caulobacteraceae bacterium]|nr:guanylate kinase [Caulobacteraceae bacterium]